MSYISIASLLASLSLSLSCGYQLGRTPDQASSLELELNPRVVNKTPYPQLSAAALSVWRDLWRDLPQRSQEADEGARAEIMIGLGSMSVTWRAPTTAQGQSQGKSQGQGHLYTRARSLRVTARWRGVSASAQEAYVLTLDGRFIERDELVTITDRLTRRALNRLSYELSSADRVEMDRVDVD